MKRCARCGRTLPATRARLYSRFTLSYYCPDFAACGKRAAKRRRADQLQMEVRR